MVLPVSRKQVEGTDVGSDDGEVPPIERCDVADDESFGGSDHRCVDGAERECAVSRNEFGDAQPVRRRDRFDDEVAGREISQKANFGIDAQSRAQEIGDLGDHECGHDQWPGVRFE